MSDFPPPYTSNIQTGEADDSILYIVHIAYIALGANLGDKRQALKSAVDAIGQDENSRVVLGSSLYSSPPMGEMADGPDYLNAVIKIQTTRSPQSLLAFLQSIEQQFGRTRTHANAARTLDLDILLFDDVQMSDESLTLPHPRMYSRAFVMVPLFEIEPALELIDNAGARKPLKSFLGDLLDQKLFIIPNSSFSIPKE